MCSLYGPRTTVGALLGSATLSWCLWTPTRARVIFAPASVKRVVPTPAAIEASIYIEGREHEVEKHPNGADKNHQWSQAADGYFLFCRHEQRPLLTGHRRTVAPLAQARA